MNQIREAARFIFIGGVEGSGTSYLSTLLAESPGCALLGGNFFKIPDDPECEALANAFSEANMRLWARESSLQEYRSAMTDWRIARDNITSSQKFVDMTHFIFKRSFPFGLPRGRYTPDMADFIDMSPGSRFVVIFRDPCAATYSSFRRGFDSDLRRLAVLYCEQLTWLAGQVRAIGSDCLRVVSYHRLWENPAATLEPLAEFCGIPFEPVLKAALDQRMDSDPDTLFHRELSRSDLKLLQEYFNSRRQKQWDILLDA